MPKGGKNGPQSYFIMLLVHFSTRVSLLLATQKSYTCALNLVKTPSYTS